MFQLRFWILGKDRADDVLGNAGVFTFPLCTAEEAYSNWGKNDWTNNPNYPCKSLIVYLVGHCGVGDRCVRIFLRAGCFVCYL